MKPIEEKKLDRLLQYFIANGFDHTVEEISASVGISNKTIFNRYGNKENLELAVLELFQVQLGRRMTEKAEVCNNSVEIFLLLVDELHNAFITAKPVFDRLRQQFLASKHRLKLLEILLLLVSDGQKAQLFTTEISFLSYADFFFNTLFFFINEQTFSTDVVFYVILPLLTPDGKRLLDDIDVEHLLFGEPMLPKIEREDGGNRRPLK